MSEFASNASTGTAPSPAVSRSDFDAPFGKYALPAWREAIRRFASHMPVNKLGNLLSSGCRRLSLFAHASGLNGPFDVAVADGVRARLYPASNRCEKRAFAGVQHWDGDEIAELVRAVDAVAAGNKQSSFVFLDVGSNVGLYSLFVSAAVRRHAVPASLIAIEPDLENRSRLMFNAAASGAELIVEAVAIAEKQGTGQLSANEKNRGGVHLVEKVEIGGQSVPLETLAHLANRHGLSHINAMKVDIEGKDLAALTHFFQTAPETLFPELLILETGRDGDSPLIDLATSHGYSVAARPTINTILTRQGVLGDTA